MKKWIALLMMLYVWGHALSQDERSLKTILQEADKYYAEEQFNLAIQFYRGLTDQKVQDPDVYFRLAECYRKTFNYPEAEAYYLKVYYAAPKRYPLSLYYYALMLKYNANFDESVEYFDEFISRNKENPELYEYLEQAVIDKAGSEMAKLDLRANREKLVLLSLKFNTRYNDFAPSVRDSTSIVITSGRFASNRQSIDERFGEAFTDNYYFEKVDGTWQDRTRQMFSITNTRFNDGSGCFNSTGDKYYFTVCGMDGPQCRIFLTTYANGKWSEPQPLNENVNYRTFESKHPAISHGGDTLMFASNRPGGSGKFDIWMSVNAGNDNWGPAMNLGSSVNTKLNEVAPSLTSLSHILFFASDGHPGYGGLDMFMARRLSTADTLLYNLDHPFNTNLDDCFITFDDRKLYWSSNRSEGQGGFDVFTFGIKSVLDFTSLLSLKKRTDRRDIILASKTEKKEHLSLLASRVEERIDYDNLTYEKKRIVEKMVANRIQGVPDNADQFTDLSGKEFASLSQLAEERYQVFLQQKSSDNRYLARVTSPKNGGQDISITGTLLDSATLDNLISFKILLIDSLGEVLKTTESNEQGKFRFTGVPAAQELYLRLERTSYGDLKPLISGIAVKGHATKRTLHFENIYFDFDHYRIRPEAAKVLDDLAEQLIRNPDVQLEIYAFADDRGSNQYNLRLTQKRGQSVVDYLIGKGVDQTGIAIIAKGKQTQQESSGLELQRQFNRRVELYLNGTASIAEETVKTYILKKQIDWSTLSNLTGIAKEKLQLLNGSTDEQLKAFQPVRIPEHAKDISSQLFFIGI